MFELSPIQTALREQGVDGWLLYDFRGSNILAQRVVQLPAEAHCTRRWLYWIPAEGQPLKLCHRIEGHLLDHLPGEKRSYLKWQEFEAGVAELLKGQKRIAMEYSPRNGNPYLSRVDAGTIELVRSLGCEIVSSGDLVQQFEAVWTREQWDLHQAAGVVTDSAFSLAWTYIAQQIREQGETTEQAVQQQILEHFARHDVITDSGPIVAVGPHSGDPHYETGDSPIRAGDFVLVDLWAKRAVPNGVYSDLTRVGFVGASVPETYARVFQIVAQARDAAIQTVREAFAQRRPICGWEVDAACRKVIEEAGYGAAFVHRTGHSIGRETHGNGANMDNLETHDERHLLPGTCFSIEPGIYLPEFGIRSEVNVFIDWDARVHVTAGEVQRAIQAIEA